MRIARTTGAVSGLLITLLAIWGGIIPFVGPYFHYAFGTDRTWHFTIERFWLDVLPAAVAVWGGVMLFSSADRIRATFGSWLAIVAGAWFVLGPAASRIWQHGAGPIGGPLYGPVRQAAELVGYFYGPGILIVTLAAFALGRAVSRPSPVSAVETEPPDEPWTSAAESDRPVEAGDPGVEATPDPGVEVAPADEPSISDPATPASNQDVTWSRH